MYINIGKSKDVHFRPDSVLKCDFTFHCGSDALEIVDRYMYLGTCILLHEHLDFNTTAKHVTQSRRRDVGLLIAKRKSLGGVPYSVFT